MRKKIVAGNWKLNGNAALVEQMLAALSVQQCKAKVIICPPFPLLYLATEKAGELACNVSIGAQNLAVQAEGAFTGEVSARMIKESGADFVIVGHSERRSLFAETAEQVAIKVQQAVQNGLKPILCIGESEQENAQGLTEQVLKAQLAPVFNLIPVAQLAELVVAYEPVWAIGTGKTATPEQAQNVHRFIRNEIATIDSDFANKVTILYGGSVKPENAAELFSQADIDGGLIGGASLNASSFVTICQSA